MTIPNHQTSRWARREPLLHLLSRLDRGTLLPVEAPLLRAAVECELRDGDDAHVRAEQAEDLLRVAHETSNRSEAERARAVQRAEQAEAALARVRALADRWCLPGHISTPIAADDIRAVLDGPADTPGHHPDTPP